MFGLNNAQLIGRLGADVTVNQSGQRRQASQTSRLRPMKATSIGIPATGSTAPSGTGS